MVAADTKQFHIDERDIADAFRPTLAAQEAELRRTLEDALRRSAEGAIDALLERLAEPAELPTVFDLADPAVTGWLDSYVPRLARSLNEEAARELMRVVRGGVAEGMSGNEIRKLVEESPSFSADGIANRAEMIVRSESARAHVRGRIEGWRQSGVVAGKRWLLAPDPCEFCEATAAEFAEREVDVDAAFYRRGATLTGSRGGTMLLDYEDVQGPPLHPNCLLPQTRVAARGQVAGLVADFDGPAVELAFADGARLAVTANHQLLTPIGFASADTLRQGDYLVRGRVFERIVTGDPDDDHCVAAVEDAVHAFAAAPGVASRRMPVAAEQLHGDGRFADGHVHVVSSDRLLRDAPQTAPFKHAQHLPLCAAWGDADFIGLGDLDAMLVGLSLAAHGVMGCRGPGQSLLGSRVAHAHEHRFAASARSETLFGHAASKRDPVDLKLMRQLLQRFARLVTVDQITYVRQFDFRGHVYDLQTASGLYIANTVLSSNCRCDIIEVLKPEYTGA